MNKISQKFLALLLSLLTVLGPMTTAALATEASPGESGNMTERFLDESTSRELAAPAVSNRVYLGYTTEITYVYHHGNSVLTGSCTALYWWTARMAAISLT